MQLVNAIAPVLHMAIKNPDLILPLAKAAVTGGTVSATDNSSTVTDTSAKITARQPPPLLCDPEPIPCPQGPQRNSNEPN